MDTPFNEQVTIEFLMKDDVNVIRVDWSELARSINYFTAAGRVPEAGMILGQFIDFLHFYNAVDFNQIKIVGFSLGGKLATSDGVNDFSYFSSPFHTRSYSSSRRICGKKCAAWQNSHDYRSRSSWFV